MITTCTRHLPVGGGREPSYRVLDGFFAREPAGLNGFFAPAEDSRSCVRTSATDPPAPTADAGALASLPVGRLPGQEAAPRPGPEDLPAVPRAGQQTGRAGRVLLRPDLLDRLCDRGDPAGAGRGQPGRRGPGHRAGPAGGPGHRGPAGPAGRLLPPGGRRLPVGRRGVCGQPGQLRQRHRRRGWGGPADRLRAHRGGQRVQRGRRHVLGLPRPAGPGPGRDLGRVRGPARLGQPARPPRGGPDLRRPHLRVRGQRRGHDRGRHLAAGRRRPRPDRLLPRAGPPAHPGGRRRGGDGVPGPAGLRLGHDRPHRGRGHLQRRLGLPRPRGRQRQEDPDGDGDHHGDAVPGHHLAGRAAGGATVRERLPDGHLPDRPAGPGRRPGLHPGPGGHPAHPGPGGQHRLLRVPAAGQLRLQRRPAAPAAAQAGPPAGLLQRHHRPVGGGHLPHRGLQGRHHALIPLYAVGVVTSFTLAQAGMTRRHLRLREPGWRSGTVINGVGAVVTAVALAVIVIGKFTEGAWMVAIAIPLLVWLLLRIQHTYGRELAQLKVQASHRLAPPKPRHEVVILLEDLDQAALSALQYARQLNPLSITALHIAVDPDHARELARLWAKVHIPIPLELVDAPDRNLPATVEETFFFIDTANTEVTVLVPRRRYVGFWRRVLHDQTSAELTKVLGDLDNVNVTIVPYRLRRRSSLRPVPDGPTTAATRTPDRGASQ